MSGRYKFASLSSFIVETLTSFEAADQLFLPTLETKAEVRTTYLGLGQTKQPGRANQAKQNFLNGLTSLEGCYSHSLAS